MTNKINNQQIVYSIEMKDKWLNGIFKKSRKTEPIEKFWYLILDQLHIKNINSINIKKVYISPTFFNQLTENMDNSFNDLIPKKSKEIDSEDYSIYFSEGYLFK